MLDASKAALAKRYLPLFGAFAILIWHSLQFNFVTDDAYISFVYSHNFAEHGQLVFNPGEVPVEGYTNFLWTFLLGVLMVVGLPPEIMALVFGTAFALATMAVAMRLVEHVCKERSAWDYLAPVLLACSSGYACWSSGGLETQMFTFFVTLAIYAYVRADGETRFYRLLGISLALAAMTRPEGLLITGLVGGHRLLLNVIRDRRLVPHRGELTCMGAFLLFWAPWFAWRWWYYGHFFPNTYYVKAAGKASAKYVEQMHANGRYYIWQWLQYSKVLYAAPVALVGLAVAKPRTSRFVLGTLSLLVTMVYLIYTMRVGGDFMGLHRFVMPLFVISAIGTALGLRLVVGLLPGSLHGKVGAGLASAVVMLFAWSQYKLTSESVRWGNWKSDRGIDTPAYLALYAHDRSLIGKQMRQCFVPEDFSIFGGVGAKPFYAETKGIDVFGLVSDVVAHEVPRTRARAGHNKWAPDSLLLKTYKPSFVFHCYSLHGDPNRPHINCRGNFWQRNGYEQVTLHVPGLKERGEYYTFFVAKERVASFRETCPGIVK